MPNDEQRLLGQADGECAYETLELAAAEPDLVIGLFERFRYVIAAVLIALALVSFLPLKGVFSDPGTYASTIETLDEKKANVTALVASSTALSAGISALPEDTGSAVADKLMDVSVDLGIVLAVIYLEKYLLTILGFLAFGILAPVGLASLAISVVLLGRSSVSRAFAHVAVRLLLLGAVLVSVVPASVWITDRIDETYAVSASAETAAEQPEAGTEAQEEQEGSNEGGVLDFIADIPRVVAGIPQAISDGVTSVTQDILDQANAMIESFAVMIVTSCVVPILVLVFFLWAANMLLGIKVEVPVADFQRRARGARRGARSSVASMRDSAQKSA